MRKTWVMLGCVVAAFFLAWCIRTVYVVRYAPARAFDTAAPEPTRVRASVTPAPTISPEERLRLEADEDFMKDRVNILLLGFDQSPERDDETSDVYRDAKNDYRSDVLMLLAVNFAENSAHLISVPRDTYSPIYNTKGRWKINAAFAKGGAAEGEGFYYAQQTLEMLFGVPIPYYVGVNMEGLKAAVDAIGGLDYDVDVEIHLNGCTLLTGYQHLNGQQVLDYCRARKGISTDLGRNDRQQRVLFAIFEQMKQKGTLTSITSVYAAVKGDIYTNLSAAQFAALAAFGLDLGMDNLKRSTLEGAYVNNIYNASYYVLENKKLAALVKEEFGIKIERASKYDLATVKRDKAAAEAKRAAESVPEIETLAVIPADSTGSFASEQLDTIRMLAAQLNTAVDSGASVTELRRLQHRLNAAVAAFLRENPGLGTLPPAFSALQY